MSKSVLSFAQRMAVYEKLKEVCKKIGDGMCEYSPGWDDNKVAQVMGNPVSYANVLKVRQDMFGKLRPRNTSSDTDKRLTAIEDYLTSKWPDWKSHVDKALL